MPFSPFAPRRGHGIPRPPKAATVHAHFERKVASTGEPKPTDVIIQIFHTADGRMVALNFGKNGYMVTMVSGQETTCVRDGNCLPS